MYMEGFNESLPFHIAKYYTHRCTKAIKEMVMIGDETNLYEDLGAGTKKLVEIAVRALSPGINDPGTAIFCIEKLGFLLQKSAKALEAKIYHDEKKRERLIVQGLTFEKLLFYHFYQIKHYGLEDLSVLDAILSSLITISKGNNYLIKNEVWAFCGYILSGINFSKKLPLEIEYIKERVYQLAMETNQRVKFDEVISGFLNGK